MIDEKTVIHTAVVCYGIDSQRTKCVEELSELIKELCKNKLGACNRFHIAEEISDVVIMLAQMVDYYGIAELVEQCKAAKLEQLADKLNLKCDDMLQN